MKIKTYPSPTNPLYFNEVVCMECGRAYRNLNFITVRECKCKTRNHRTQKMEGKNDTNR